MVPQRPQASALRRDPELDNKARNELQKTVLLCEVSKIRRDEVRTAIETSKRIVEESKKLCDREHPANRVNRKAR